MADRGGAEKSPQPRQQAWRDPERTVETFEQASSVAKVWTTGELPTLGASNEEPDEDGETSQCGKGRMWRPRPLQENGGLKDMEEASASLKPLPFRRAVTTPGGAACSPSPSTVRSVRSVRSIRSGFDDQDFDEDSDMDFTVSELPPRRAVTEPARGKRRPGFLATLFNVDTALPFARTVSKGSIVLPRRAPVVNLVLCAVSLAAGCIFPVLVDLSKTATAKGPNGEEVARLPYSPDSVLRAEASFNVCLGILAIAVTRRSLQAFRPLLNWELHRQMLPLTLVYVMGDIAALCAINSAGGPLYMAISNSRLLFAAGVSHCYLGRRQTRRQWLVLAEISVATATFAALNRGGESKGDASSLRALVGIAWALAKAFLSGLAAVLTESHYKKIDLWHANTLLKGQSLVVAIVGGLVHSWMDADDVPLCDSPAADLAPWCVDRKGWDFWSWAVLASEISTGWLSVAVLTRMSAIAKFVCKTATAPTVYVLYSWKRLGGFSFEVSSFCAVLMIALGILAYTAEPYFGSAIVSLRRYVSTWFGTANAAWVCHYPFQQRPG